ncbi:MAG: hypothetical protein JXQ29_02970 [Planctomycetes bacterium]|nr:hypothetical protein [Planctomycetota bacterium]
MANSAKCPGCQRAVLLADGAAGAKLSCWKCGQALRVVESDDGTLELVDASSGAPALSPVHRARKRRTRRIREARTWILVLAALFFVSGSTNGTLAAHEAAAEKARIADLPDDEPLPQAVDGKRLTAGEYRRELERKTVLAYAEGYALAGLMLLVYYWARKAPVPAIAAAFGIFVAVVAIVAMILPESLLGALPFKIAALIILPLGLYAAAAEQAETRR